MMKCFHELISISTCAAIFWHPDEKKHPGFKQVRWLRVEVQAGDILYIPAFWFHVIQSEGERNVVVNHWFAQSPEAGVLLRTSTPPTIINEPCPRLCTSIDPKCESCSDLGRVLVLNDPPARTARYTMVRTSTAGPGLWFRV